MTMTAGRLGILLLLQGTMVLSLAFFGRVDGWSTRPTINTDPTNHHRTVAGECQEESSASHCDDSRRSFLFRSSFMAALVFLPAISSAQPCHAATSAAPLDAGEAIRRSTANIPGYGQTDVFYPSSLAGKWEMTRLVDFGNGRDPLRLNYPFRFIQSIEDNAVVADRGVNQAELEKAIRRTVLAGKDTDNNTDDDGTSVRSYEWVPTNPNDLRLVLSDGTRKEIKVTKRATERTDGTVSSSEFQRITQEDQRGIPDVSARRVTTKWKLVDENTLEGLEIIYSMAGGDPMSAASNNKAGPTVLSKSRMVLVRQ
jgi:hypothetical protein